MKNFFIILLLLPISLYSQNNDIVTLQKLSNQITEDNKAKAEAKEKIYSYYYDTKDEIRKLSDRLTTNQYDYLVNYQDILWQNIVSKSKGYKNSTEFLTYETGSLQQFRAQVLDKAYAFIKANKDAKLTEISYNTIDTISADESKPELLIEAKIYQGKDCNIEQGSIKLYRPDEVKGVYFEIDVNSGPYGGYIDGYLKADKEKGWFLYKEDECLIRIKVEVEKHMIRVEQQGCLQYSGAAICFEGWYK